MSVHQHLLVIQGSLKVPKSQYNAFGKYHYRKAEDILEAVKPLAVEQGCTLIVSDTLVFLGDRFYVQSTATLTDTEDGSCVCCYGYAREEDEKKGMDPSQITGASSSYARKYALCGLFGIDDSNDSDVTNNNADTQAKPAEPKKAPATAQKKLTEAIAKQLATLAAKGMPCKNDGRTARQYLIDEYRPTQQQLAKFDTMVQQLTQALNVHP